MAHRPNHMSVTDSSAAPTSRSAVAAGPAPGPSWRARPGGHSAPRSYGRATAVRPCAGSLQLPGGASPARPCAGNLPRPRPALTTSAPAALSCARPTLPALRPAAARAGPPPRAMGSPRPRQPGPACPGYKEPGPIRRAQLARLPAARACQPPAPPSRSPGRAPRAPHRPASPTVLHLWPRVLVPARDHVPARSRALDSVRPACPPPAPARPASGSRRDSCLAVTHPGRLLSRPRNSASALLCARPPGGRSCAAPPRAVPPRAAARRRSWPRLPPACRQQ